MGIARAIRVNWIFLKKRTEYHSTKRDKNIWLFGEWFGERAVDNCLYMANYVCENHPEIHVYWTAIPGSDLSLLHPMATVIEYDSAEARKIYKTAGFVFMNQGFVDFSKDGYNYFSGGTTINLWHGVAWKRIGHDAFSHRKMFGWISKKMTDFRINTDKYLTPSDTFENCLISAFDIKKDQCIRAGYPRNTILYSNEACNAARGKVQNIIRKRYGNIINNKSKVLVYLPTFRDNAKNTISISELCEDKAFLDWMLKNQIYIIQKVHSVSQKRGENVNSVDDYPVMQINDVSAAELLAASDMLITDYSSCFFDYLITDKPIAHFIYDFEYYSKKDRGLYFDVCDAVCGDTAQTLDELKKVIIDNITHPEKEAGLRGKRRKQFMEYESTDACRKIFEAVISGQ